MLCIIVDDDEMARVSMKMLCEKIDDLEVVGEFDNGMDAVSFLQKNDIDVVFLDIEMPEFSGLDLVKSVEDLPQIVFTTSHPEHAVEAFEYQVTDFLPKPVQFSRLLKTVDRINEILDNVKKEDEDELFVRVNGRFVRLDLSNIMYIESLGDYVTFHDENGKKYIVHSTIKNIDNKISNSNFIKVHRSYVINTAKVVDIEESNLVIGDKVIPISRAHKASLLKHIRTL